MTFKHIDVFKSHLDIYKSQGFVFEDTPIYPRIQRILEILESVDKSILIMN